MKMNLRSVVFMAALGLGSAAHAQTITVEDVSGQAGDTVTVQVLFTSGATAVAGYDFDIGFDDVNLDPAIAADCDSGFSGFGNCSVSGENDTNEAGDAVNVIFAAASAFGDGVLAEFTVTIDAGAAPGVYPLPITPVGVSDPLGMDIMPDPTTYNDGSITVVTGPSLSAAPASVALTVPGNPDDTITISASGGAVTGISCAYTGQAAISVTGSVPATLADGASADVTATCSGATAGNFSGMFDCSSTDGGTTSTPISCAVGANASPTFNPPNGGTLTIVVPAGGQASGSVVFGNSGNAAYTVDSCSITGTAFSSSTTFPITVNPGDSDAVVVMVQDDGSNPTGSITCTLTVNSAPVTYTASLGVLVQAVTVPTLSQWAMILLALVLVGMGGMMLRKRGNFA